MSIFARVSALFRRAEKDSEQLREAAAKKSRKKMRRLTNKFVLKTIRENHEKTKCFTMDEAKNIKSVFRIGRGGFGEVFLVEKCNQEAYAVKVVDATTPAYRVYKETMVHERLCENDQNEHVVKLLSNFSVGFFHFHVMEFAESGSLWHAIHMKMKKGLKDAEVGHYLKELLLAVAFMHDNSIAHRDIKSQNCLLSYGSAANEFKTLKLCDFGVSVQSRIEDRVLMRKDFVGSYATCAPEVVKSRANRSYDPELADIWSCGVVLFEMVTGKKLWDKAAQSDGAFAKFSQGNLSIIVSSERIRYLGCMGHILRMLRLAPNDRPSATELLETPVFAPLPTPL